MAQTTVIEFQRKFGEFQHQAQREPVEIIRHGRRDLVLMSADHYDWLVAAARRTHRTTDATVVVADAVRRAELDPEQPASIKERSGRPVWSPQWTRPRRHASSSFLRSRTRSLTRIRSAWKFQRRSE